MDDAREAMAGVEQRAAAALDLSGADTLVAAGAALFLLVGEILFGEILGGSIGGSTLSIGGISLPGVLAGEVLLYLLVLGPRPGKAGMVSANTTRVIIAVLVTAIFLFVFGDFISTLKNLGTWTGLGIVAILESLSRWAGALLMALGVLSAWGPTPTAARAAARN